MSVIIPLIVDFAKNLLGSAIFDFAKTGLGRSELVQTVLLQIGSMGAQNDFHKRYVEALVELRLMGKHPKVLEFFREESIMQAFYDYYYDYRVLSEEQKQADFEASIDHYLSSLAVGDKIKEIGTNISVELKHFQAVFRKQIQESQTVKEVEFDQKLAALQVTVENLPKKIEGFWQWMQENGKQFFQNGEKIWNINEIGQANFNFFIKGEHKLKHILMQPSLVPEIFLGREDDLLRIHDTLFANGGNMLLLNGEGGLGKTSLAARYFDRYKAEYAHVAWVTSNGNLADAVLTLAAPLGLIEEESFLRLDTSQRIEKLLNAMSNLPRPCLLVVDNANELEDLEAYYPELQCCSNFHFLFTTRITEYGTAAFLGLAPLPEPLALQMFRTHYNAFAPTDERHFRELYRAVGGNTLVLEVFAKNLGKLNNNLKRRYSLEEIVGDVEKGLLQPGRNAAVEVRYQSLQKATPEEILGAMYKISELNPEEAALLAVFAALPPERIAFDDLEELLRQEDLDTLLLSLAQRGWLDYTEEASAFRCSPVVQAAVRRQHDKWKADCGGLLQGLKQGLNPEIIHEDNFRRSSLFARYAETTTALLDMPDVDLARLWHNLGNFHSATGDLVKVLQAFGQMERLLSALLEGNPETTFKDGLAVAYVKLGQTYAKLGNLQKAMSYFEENLQLTKELYEEFPENAEFKNGLAVSYQFIGNTHAALGNLKQALNLYEQYNLLEKELYEASPGKGEFKDNLAVSYLKLGKTQAELGNLEKALSYFEQCKLLKKELYEAFPNKIHFKEGLAIAYANLGKTHAELGDIQKAMSLFEENFQLTKELYEAFPNQVSFKEELAIAYSNLGQMQAELGNRQKEMSFFEHCNLLTKELYETFPGHMNFKRGLAISYEKLGITHIKLGNLQQAMTYFEQFNLLAKELYEAFPNQVDFKRGLAISYTKLAMIYWEHRQGKEKVRKFFEDARRHLQELVQIAPEYKIYQQNLDWVNEQLDRLNA